jgi:hypothetical protein
MKFRIILTTLVCCLLSVSLKAQTVPLPEYNEVVMFLKSDNTLVALDKSDVVTESKENLMRRILVYMKVLGSSAKVSHSGSPQNKFVVNVQPGIDPDNIVELFKFDEVKKHRKIQIASISGGWGGTHDIELPKQRLIFKKVQPGSYIISPESQLEAGEYLFLVNRPNISELGAGGKAIKGYCFSVKSKE